MTEHDSEGYREALRRGHVAVLRGRPREAIGHYEEAGRLAGSRPLPYSAMASIFLQLRQPREAIDAFDEALRRAPNDVSALRGKASALEADGRGVEAAALSRRADEVEGMARATRGSVASDESLHELEAQVAEGDSARAAADLDRAAAAYHCRCHRLCPWRPSRLRPRRLPPCTRGATRRHRRPLHDGAAVLPLRLVRPGCAAGAAPRPSPGRGCRPPTPGRRAGAGPGPSGAQPRPRAAGRRVSLTRSHRPPDGRVRTRW